jgi:hypothetical protein
MQTRLNHSIQHTDPTDHPDLVPYCYTDGSIPPARAKITNGLREALTMNVTYTDSWFWDIVMYLRSMDIRFYKAPSGGLIASGHWKNSVLHQFPNADGVVQDLMDEMFKQTGEPTAVRTKAASN